MPQHEEKRVLPFTPRQLFDLVADIESYPDFLPWCKGARIQSREGKVLTADLVIGYKMFQERFTSVVKLQSPKKIKVNYLKGPLSHLQNEWDFLPHKNGCEVRFYVDFDFESSIMRGLMDMFFHRAFLRMVEAFESRAEDIYRG